MEEEHYDQFTSEELETAEKSKKEEVSAEKGDGFMSKLAFTGSKVMSWWGSKRSSQACKCSPEDEELGCCM